ncbi:MAG TPA: YtcA family lipoprotein, partial [Edaphobacter sp.]
MNRTSSLFLAISGICLLCTGCARAPAIDVIGSFFPVWMVVLTISVILASLLRWYLVRNQLEPAIEPRRRTGFQPPPHQSSSVGSDC